MGGLMYSKKALKKEKEYIVPAAFSFIILTVSALFIFILHVAGASGKSLFVTWLFCFVFNIIPVVVLLFFKKYRTWLILLSLVVLFVSYKLIFKEVSLLWVVFISMFFLFITLGGVIVQMLESKFTEDYLVSEQIKIKREIIEELERFFYIQQSVYYAIPLGFLAGIILSYFLKLNSFDTFLLSIKTTVGIAIVLMVRLAVLSFKFSSRPLMHLNSKDKQEVGLPYLWVRLEESTEQSDTVNLKLISDETKINIGIALSKIRMNYFYYNLLNGIIFSTLLFMLSSLMEIKLSAIFTVAMFLFITFVTCIVPYVLGQYRTHILLLYTKEGKEKVDLEESLKKYSPIFPISPMLVSLVSGIVGLANDVLVQLLHSWIEKSNT